MHTYIIVYRYVITVLGRNFGSQWNENLPFSGAVKFNVSMCMPIQWVMLASDRFFSYIQEFKPGSRLESPAFNLPAHMQIDRCNTWLNHCRKHCTIRQMSDSSVRCAVPAGEGMGVPVLIEVPYGKPRSLVCV